MIVKLPFPHPQLFPNRKNGSHWTKTNAIKEVQKSEAYYLTKQAGPYKAPDGFIPLTLMFLQPDNRHRDSDNMHAASKALLDGLAQALGVDDKRFKPVIIDWERDPEKKGALYACVGIGHTVWSNL